MIAALTEEPAGEQRVDIQSEADAHAPLAANPFAAADTPCFIDIRDGDAPLAKMVKALGFDATFETARMFSGTPPATIPNRFQAIATMELG